MNVREWAISSATAALIFAGGYSISKFDPKIGVAVVDNTTNDTLWIGDSLELEEFANKIGSGKMGEFKLGGK